MSTTSRVRPGNAALAAYDETGMARADARVPGSVQNGRKMLTLVGNKTGTTVPVPVLVQRK